MKVNIAGVDDSMSRVLSSTHNLQFLDGHQELFNKRGKTNKTNLKLTGIPEGNCDPQITEVESTVGRDHIEHIKPHFKTHNKQATTD